MELASSGSGGTGNGHQVLTVEDIYAELYHQAKDCGGLSCREIQDAYGWSEKKARQVLREAVGKGICTVGKKAMQNLAGVTVQVPAYIFEGEK